MSPRPPAQPPAAGPLPAGEPPEDAGAPVLRVVRGQATDEEVAALVAALAASRRPEPPAPPHSRWVDRAAQIGAALAPGPGAWLAGVWRRGPWHR